MRAVRFEEHNMLKHFCREQKGGIARFLRRLLQRPLPSAKPERHPSVFVYDLRAEFSPLASLTISNHSYEVLKAATYEGEAGAVLGVVRLSGPIPLSMMRGLLIINLRKLPHDMLRKRGLLHLVE